MIRNLVFQGGGVKGLAYAGVLQALEGAGVLPGVERVAGASAGAIAAALVACGVTSARMQEVLTHTSFRAFADGRGWLVGATERVLQPRHGVHPGRALEEWLQAQLGALTAAATGVARPALTLAELRALAAGGTPGFRELYVVATNLSAQAPRVLSADTAPELPVWKAVRMSMSIPLYFEAVEHDGAWWVDGGVSWNYPIDLFDGCHRQPVAPAELPLAEGVATGPAGANAGTLGFSLGSRAELAALGTGWQLPPASIGDLTSYVEALAEFMVGEATLLHLDASDHARTVFVDTVGVRTTQFDLTATQAAALVASGAAATRAFLASATPS